MRSVPAPRWRCWVEGAAGAMFLALLVAGVFGLAEMPAPTESRPDPMVVMPLPRKATAEADRSQMWEARARVCSDLLSQETGAGYDLDRGDIETAAARATEWAEHVSELEDAYGD